MVFNKQTLVTITRDAELQIKTILHNSQHVSTPRWQDVFFTLYLVSSLLILFQVVCRYGIVATLLFCLPRILETQIDLIHRTTYFWDGYWECACRWWSVWISFLKTMCPNQPTNFFLYLRKALTYFLLFTLWTWHHSRYCLAVQRYSVVLLYHMARQQIYNSCICTIIIILV
jgi:hypothetical protein